MTGHLNCRYEVPRRGTKFRIKLSSILPLGTLLMADMMLQSSVESYERGQGSRVAPHPLRRRENFPLMIDMCTA